MSFERGPLDVDDPVWLSACSCGHGLNAHPASGVTKENDWRMPCSRCDCPDWKADE